MARVFSNGAARDFVQGAFERLAGRAQTICLAAPYYDHSELVVAAARTARELKLLVCLNAATTPAALRDAKACGNVDVRFYTTRMHAKIFLFDECALLGSANLTKAGMQANREAVICLDEDRDRDDVDEVRRLFFQLWETASVLTPQTLASFEAAWKLAREKPNRDDDVLDAIGHHQPPNIDASSRVQSKQRVFLEGLRRQVYEQYKPHFDEVQTVLADAGLCRADLVDLGSAFETNRFLNWLRLTHAPQERWRESSLRDASERREEIRRFGRQWVSTTETCLAPDYSDRLRDVWQVLGTDLALAEADKDAIMRGLLSLHAFSEQLRFTKGGLKELPNAFWRANPDVDRVRATLRHLLFGKTGDFAERLHDTLYDPSRHLSMFGFFSALELFGTIHPGEFPPVNGRIAKGLRYLGFDVRGV